LLSLKKIVIIGPESTGKSTLCEQLAQHYHTDWVKEYARTYLSNKTAPYTFDDLLEIAKGQIKLEEEGIQALENPGKPGSLLFIDTDMQVMKVWCEAVFGQCHNWILNRIAERRYDLYLLCNPDVEWVKDELREYPDLKTRARLYQHYKEAMVSQNVPWVDIRGNYEERLQTAIRAVDALI
jgi:NadR type nicotinamide-nucleotide adenylyltransferase